jgi:hypothetical protein
MHRCLGIGTALLILGLAATASFAQIKDPLIGLDDQIEAARKLMQTERRLVHATELALTPEESKAFWPIYNEYAAEIKAVGDRRVKLITDYADNFDDITDEFANHSLKEAFDIDAELLKVQKKYVSRFKRVLPVVKVVRFYQVENKLNAVIDFQLASQIPLMRAAGQVAD